MLHATTQKASAERYGALLFASYAVALANAEAVVFCAAQHAFCAAAIRAFPSSLLVRFVVFVALFTDPFAVLYRRIQTVAAQEQSPRLLKIQNLCIALGRASFPRALSVGLKRVSKPFYLRAQCEPRRTPVC